MPTSGILQEEIRAGACLMGAVQMAVPSTVPGIVKVLNVTNTGIQMIQHGQPSGALIETERHIMICLLLRSRCK
jgi:hypothetical protein